jgi:hypothetical protein
MTYNPWREAARAYQPASPVQVSKSEHPAAPGGRNDIPQKDLAYL